MICKAVILAAGMGLRIREHHSLPKGFIKINDKPIILRSLEILRQHGIREILVVTGYGAEKYEAISEGLFTTVKNEIYHRSGSLYSLYCAKDWIDDDFLLLESDLVYEANAIQALCHDVYPNEILVSNLTHSSDEIYVSAKNNLLVNMSKNKKDLNGKYILGEFVGISRLSLDAYQKLVTLLQGDLPLLENGHYEEDGLIRLTTVTDIVCLKVPDLKWCEIDNLEQLMRAKRYYQEFPSDETTKAT